MEAEHWIPIVLFVVGTMATAVGALVFWILNSIKAKQQKIWDWADKAVHELRRDISIRQDSADRRITDLNRYIRHAVRQIYTEMLELAKHDKDGDSIARSILKTLKQDDKD